MSARDIKVLNGHLYGVKEFQAEDRTTSSASATIKAGEPVKRNDANFALLVASGDPEIGTDILIGVAAAESTETSSADGTVLVTVLGPGSVMRGKPTTTTNMDTASELAGILLDFVTFDVSTDITIDENEGDDPNVHGLNIVAGDVDKLTLDVTPHVNVTLFGSLVGQTMD